MHLPWVHGGKQRDNIPPGKPGCATESDKERLADTGPKVMYWKLSTDMEGKNMKDRKNTCKETFGRLFI